ncbi:glucose-6-phosphate exchanger SLC37A2 isoform X2 [Cimex lectularius]|uniref:Sugar phosphate exchanger 3 n=1 Tax=Cimex lectularius TaxID=79782 RepID=A0A8I6S0J4_CIMLE|nr:glucose-6-phosphate exchanger SLC37A2 isoform X2 [Cimex lectularius]
MIPSEETPSGVTFVHWLLRKFLPERTFNKLLWYRTSVLVLTYITYICYHAAKRPLAVLKSYFNRSCTDIIPPPYIIINDTNRDTWCDWAPFDGPHAGTVLGALDSSFLFAYAASMFVSGFVAERMSLRYFLAVGMITTGISCYLFGLAKYVGIHFLSYYIFVQIFGGIVQSTGWPAVVAVMGNWYGKSKRGLIFGIWNSHTSVGNMLGSIIASYFLTIDWGLSFIVPGLITAAVGFINFLFLVDKPEHVDIYINVPDESEHSVQHEDQSSESAHENSDNPNTALLSYQEREERTRRDENAIGMIAALKIPAVVEFSLCLFFAKLVCYTLLFWLPFYINKSTTYGEKFSGYISTIFDTGGIAGGIIAGVLSDHSGKSALTCSFMLLVSIPLLCVYFLYNELYKAASFALNVTLLALVGFFVNGPYALITTAVSAELGTHNTLVNNSKALATVTAIIDGTGSIGAAVGPLLAGILLQYGWDKVFYMLLASNICAFLMLTRLVLKELFETPNVRG